jgi:competence ComEA-like helix-hairpin-helix protein
MNTTPQERLALGVIALLVAAGAGARMLHRDAPPATLSGPSAEADAGALAALTSDVERKTADAQARSRPLAPGEHIDPNTAPAEELDRLPKVGPAQARRIVAWREAHGGFRTLADLDSVPGIGAAAISAIAPYVTLPPAPEQVRAPVESATLPSAVSSPSPAPISARPAEVVDVNAAGEAELQTLPGIGPALARRIVEYRAAHGPFRSAGDLANVRGIGPATAAKLAPSVRASP